MGKQGKRLCAQGSGEQWDGEARRNPAEEQSVVGKQGERLCAQGSGSGGSPGAALLFLLQPQK